MDDQYNIPADWLQYWRGIGYPQWAAVFRDLPEQSGHFCWEVARDHSWAALQTLLRKGGLQVSSEGMKKVLTKLERWQPGKDLE